MHTDGRKSTVRKEGQDKIGVIFDGSDTISCLFSAWKRVHHVSQIAAKSPLANALKEFL